ncbi:MAG: hypothetical protein IPH46_14995 [Bacteroidetes bacterium]|nr:hypothetical protein [Bacteroidota bacterium]
MAQYCYYLYFIAYEHFQYKRHISNLTFGTYTVQAVDANGCNISTIVDVYNPTPIVITSIVSTIANLCAW